MNFDVDQLQKLRAVGVKRIEVSDKGVGMVEFFPSEAEVSFAASPVPKHLDLDGPKTCTCGHDEISHNAEGMCLQGCDAENCWKDEQ